LTVNPILRVAAFSLCLIGAAHANPANSNANPPTPDAGAAATPIPNSARAETELKRQLIRASWYGGGERLAGHTSTGEIFRPMGHTAAHRTLPFGTLLKVTEAASGRSTIVRINDRGPSAASGRSIDLSRGAALDLGITRSGEARVYIEVMR
jgi:rare lipoprotein A